MPGTAIFDLDRTITRLATWTPFLFYVNGMRPGFLVQIPLIALRMIGYKLGLCSRDSIKEQGLRTLARHDRATLEARAKAFIDRRLATGLRPGALAVIEAHRARGDRLIMATASIDVVADALGRALGFDEVVSTRLKWGADGVHPEMDGPNCYGAEKLRRIDEARRQRPFQGPVYAYSDDISDFELLCQVDHGVAVNPTPALRRAAQARGIEIADFDQQPLVLFGQAFTNDAAIPVNARGSRL